MRDGLRPSKFGRAINCGVRCYVICLAYNMGTGLCTVQHIYTYIYLISWGVVVRKHIAQSKAGLFPKVNHEPLLPEAPVDQIVPLEKHATFSWYVSSPAVA